jgi:DNA replication licensing factor MCM2
MRVGDGDAGAAAEEEDGPQPLEQQLLRKFISYARASVKPVLHDVDSEKIAALYADLRAQSAISGGYLVAHARQLLLTIVIQHRLSLLLHYK